MLSILTVLLALAQTYALPAPKPGDSANLWAFCMEEGAPALERLLANFDREKYIDLMSEQGTGCIDGRLFGLSPMKAYFVRERKRFSAAGDTCIHIYEFRDEVNVTVITWNVVDVPCPGM